MKYFNALQTSKKNMLAFLKKNTKIIRNAIIATSAIIGAIIFLSGQFIDFYQRTPYFKTQDKYERIGKLCVNQRIDYFTSILGQPTFEDRFDHLTEYTYIDSDFFVQAVSKNNKVIMYSVTTRSDNFQPKLEVPIHTYGDEKSKFVTLAKTTFEQAQVIMGSNPESIIGATGAHDYGYSELYYLGNPNNYKTTVFSVNESSNVGTDSWLSNFEEIAKMLESNNSSIDFVSTFLLDTLNYNSDKDKEIEDRIATYLGVPSTKEVRSKLKINTYSEISHDENEFKNIQKIPLLIPFGPNFYEVRNLPGFKL